VSDGQHKDRYTVLNIRVKPLTLSLWNVTQSVIVQGEVSTLVDQIHVVSTGSPQRIIYNVTRPPSHGHLYRNDRVVGRYR